MRASPAASIDALRRLLDRAPTDAGPLWLRRRRREALARFRERGLPTTRDEEWRETSLRTLETTVFEPAVPGAGSAERDPVGLAGGSILLPFVDGRCAIDDSPARPAGIWLGNLEQAVAQRPGAIEPLLGRLAPEGHPFADLNTALFADLAVVVVEEGAEVDPPVVILHETTAGERPGARFPRTLIVAGARSRVRFVEVHFGPDGDRYWTCPVTEIACGDGAVVRHRFLQLDGRDALHTAVVASSQGRDSDLRCLHASFGAALARADIGARLAGPGAHCTLDGLYVVDAARHSDAHTTVDHAAPHCTSHELFKGILAGAATGVFKGRIIVRADAQKTDAVQHNANLLLSREAKVHTRPQLEIRADDVRCTHGATIGQLDPEALFYLRSRGLPGAEARRLLIQGFAREVLDGIDDERLRSALAHEIDDRIPPEDPAR